MTLKIIRNTARYLISIVFIFSGFVKAIDPLGSHYKFSDYFEAFGLGFLGPLSLSLAVLLSSAELLIGLCLFFKVRMRTSSWALLLFMIFFTILTLIIALTDPVSDCGCFGDALILTNWQTFFKNLIFLVPTLIVFRERNNFQLSFIPKIEWSLVIFLFAVTILLSVYCIRNLPFVDFRPYKLGANIPESMEVPEGMPVDEYETVLVYERGGIQQEFTLESSEEPWSDSTWLWIETKNVLISKGYVPPIHDFSLSSSEGEDITSSVLFDSEYSFLFVAYDLKKSNKNGLKKINKFIGEARSNGYNAYGMTSSVVEEVEEVSSNLDLNFDFYTTDEITLKTMIRCNPGLMLIKDGTVIGKWHHRNIPGKEFLKTQGLSYCLAELEKNKNDYFGLGIVIVICLIGLLIFIFRQEDSNSLS